ncbi:MAG: CRISPR-associated protein Cas4 [Candidatus Micrarchaeia archaeon]
MFSVAFQEITEQIIEKLAVEAEKITVRGFNPGSPVELSADLAGMTLPVNLMANKYCPTDRYTYIYHNKLAKRQLTWASFQGKTTEKVYFKMLKKFKMKKFEDISKKGIFEATKVIGKEEIDEKKVEFEKIKEKIVGYVPTKKDVEIFFENLEKLVVFESLIASSIIEYRLSRDPSKSISSYIESAFPFEPELEIKGGTEIGFSEKITPDFVFDSKIIGDIKTGEHKPFFEHTLAAYAIAYEKENKKPMNFGIILNPQFGSSQTTIDYQHAKIVLIDDVMRKAFLYFRNEKLDLIKKGHLPDTCTKEICQSCCFVKDCSSIREQT